MTSIRSMPLKRRSISMTLRYAISLCLLKRRRMTAPSSVPIKARLEALRAKLDLMAATGILPRDLARLRVEIDVRQVASTIIDVFSSYAVPLEAQQAVIEAIESRSGTLNGAMPSVASSENGAHG